VDGNSPAWPISTANTANWVASRKFSLLVKELVGRRTRRWFGCRRRCRLGRWTRCRLGRRRCFTNSSARRLVLVVSRARETLERTWGGESTAESLWCWGWRKAKACLLTRTGIRPRKLARVLKSAPALACGTFEAHTTSYLSCILQRHIRRRLYHQAICDSRYYKHCNL
jgi:hypothetical protein